MTMRLFSFSFKNEAMWTMTFALAPLLIGILVTVFAYLIALIN